MEAVLAYLTSHPIVAAACVVVAGILVFALAKRLFKLALLLVVVFALGGGTIFQKAKDAWNERGKDMFEKAGKTVEREVRKKISDIGEAMRTGDSTRVLQDTVSRMTHRRSTAR
jgi:uncharacterized membrane protein required for colicin V production